MFKQEIRSREDCLGRSTMWLKMCKRDGDMWWGGTIYGAGSLLQSDKLENEYHDG